MTSRVSIVSLFIALLVLKVVINTMPNNYGSAKMAFLNMLYDKPFLKDFIT